LLPRLVRKAKHIVECRQKFALLPEPVQLANDEQCTARLMAKHGVEFHHSVLPSHRVLGERVKVKDRLVIERNQFETYLSELKRCAMINDESLVDAGHDADIKEQKRGHDTSTRGDLTAWRGALAWG
jgi:hypothetical protein